MNLPIGNHPMVVDVGKCRHYYSQSCGFFLSTEPKAIGKVDSQTGLMVGMENVLHAIRARHKLLEILINISFTAIKAKPKFTPRQMEKVIHGLVNMIFAVNYCIAMDDHTRWLSDRSQPKWNERKPGRGMEIKWYYKHALHENDYINDDRHNYCLWLFEEAKKVSAALGDTAGVTAMAIIEDVVDRKSSKLLELMQLTLGKDYPVPLKDTISAFCKMQGSKLRNYNKKILFTNQNVSAFETFLQNLEANGAGQK